MPLPLSAAEPREPKSFEKRRWFGDRCTAIIRNDGCWLLRHLRTCIAPRLSHQLPSMCLLPTSLHLKWWLCGNHFSQQRSHLKFWISQSWEEKRKKKTTLIWAGWAGSPRQILLFVACSLATSPRGTPCTVRCMELWAAKLYRPLTSPHFQILPKQFHR